MTKHVKHVKHSHVKHSHDKQSNVKHGHDEQGQHKRGGGLRKLITLVTMALTVAAVVKELRTPAPDRTWHGTVASMVPYDFRMPTLARVRERLWNPESEHYVGPRVFGVGWALNVGKVVTEARERMTRAD